MVFAKLSRNNVALVRNAIFASGFDERECAFMLALLELDKATAMRLMHELTWIVCGLDDPFDRGVSDAELV